MPNFFILHWSRLLFGALKLLPHLLFFSLLMMICLSFGLSFNFDFHRGWAGCTCTCRTCLNNSSSSVWMTCSSLGCCFSSEQLWEALGVLPPILPFFTVLALHLGNCRILSSAASQRIASTFSTSCSVMSVRLTGTWLPCSHLLPVDLLLEVFFNLLLLSCFLSSGSLP